MAAAARAQVEDAMPPAQQAQERYAIDRYSARAGFAGVVMNLALQTSDGYLWLATPPGLRRFDGVRFQTFRAGEPAAMASNTVNCLLEDAEGFLWIGTSRGALRYRDGLFESVGPVELEVKALAKDSQGAVWIATGNKGLHVWRGGRLTSVALDGLPADAPLQTVFCDHNDRVWIAPQQGAGVLVLENDTVRQIGQEQREFTYILSIAEQPAGTLWFGSQRHGLFRQRDGRLQQFALKEGSHPTITDVRTERNGGLWVSAEALWLIRDLDRVVATPIPDLPADSVRSVFEDREEGVWLCAGAAGLMRMRAMHYRSLSESEGLPGNNIKHVTEDVAGNLWLGLQHEGVLQVSPSGKIKRHGPDDGVPASDPTIVYAGRDGRVWAGFSTGLFVNTGGPWKPYSDFRFIRGFFEERKGALWIGTRSNGLVRIAGDSTAEIKLPSGEPILRASAFSEAPDGSVYIGTRNDGLYHFKDGRLLSLTQAQGLPSNEIRDVHVDPEGHVWVGMRSRGLALLHGDRWYNPEELVSALANHVTAIHADAHGRLWLGTSAGIQWISRREMIAAAKNEGPLPGVHAFTGSTEALDVPVWSGSQPVVWSGSDGLIWFATRRGAVAIDPRHVESNSVPPPVHIERVLVDRQEVAHAGGVTLPAGARTLTVDYTGLSFVEPGRVRFKYRLDGYDADWVEAETHRTAFYTRLPPGAYTFRVIACNNDGVWNTTGRSLAVVQLPYFHQTYWFKAALAAAALGGIWGLYRWSHRRLRDRLERLEREHAMENERRRIAQDLHDDLGASLTEIGLFAESSVAATPEETRREMDFLAQRARSLVRSLDAVVWAVNPANDSLDELATYMGEFFQDLFASSAISARLDVASQIPRHPLAAEERSNLFLAAKEAMNNVLKHSGATEAWLRITLSGDEFQVVIEDNGRGFDVGNPGSRKGNGLTNMQSRLRKSGGAILITSAPGQGTSVKISKRFSGGPHLPKT